MYSAQPEPLSCPACGSRRVELRATPPGGNLLKMLKAVLGGPVGPGGCKFLVCKDCGHVSLLHVR